MSALKNCALRGLLHLPVLLTCFGLHAQSPTLTTEWVAGPGSEVDQVPSFVWLENGTAILDDVRLPASKQTFESLDPVTGKRRPLLNMRRAVDSLKAIEPGADIQGALPWPITFDSAGKQALYIFDGDVFQLDLNSSTFSRLTRTADVEKDPQFSPDGRFVSFVRDNNIYVGYRGQNGEAAHARWLPDNVERHPLLGLLGRGFWTP